MVLKVIGSSSKGNCYILEASSEALIIEAGCKLNEAMKALNWQLSKVAGCIISHEHNDHAGYALEYAQAGIKLLALPTVIQAKGIERNYFVADCSKAYIIGGFRVQPFAVQHDVPCVGYVITHQEMGKMVFFTDTYACRYRFKGVDTYLIEANYADEILQENIMQGRLPGMLRDRIMLSHMDIDNTVGFLQTSDLSRVQNIILVHMSAGNGNAELFKRKVAEATGMPAEVAVPGMELTLNAIPL